MPSAAPVVIGGGHVAGSVASTSSSKSRSAWPSRAVGQFVANPSALRFGNDEAAPAQTGEMVGHVGSRQPERIGKIRRIGGTIGELDEQPTSGVIREREPHAGKDLEVERFGRGGDHGPTVQ